MYIHAYQSLIWNEIVSRRIATFGLRLCEGDLVFVDSSETGIDNVDDDCIAESEDEKFDENQSENMEPESSVSRFQAMVRPLTKADIESNKFTIFDIVLPLPGHDITYPSNECAKWYEERLKQDNLSSDQLKGKHK